MPFDVGTSNAEAAQVQKMLQTAGYRVDNTRGEVTKAFIKTLVKFQRDNALKPTGDAGPQTWDALALATTSAPPDYQITMKGKTYLLTEREYKIVVRRAIRDFSNKPYRAIRFRVIEARSVWDHFNELNNDQYVVSWMIDTFGGPSLPSEKLIRNAEKALGDIDKAMQAQDLAKLRNAVAKGEPMINRAVDQMRAYRKGVIKGAGNWVTGLTITKTAAFTTLSILAAPAAATYGAGAVASGVIAGSGSSAIESLSSEAGKAFAGTSDGVGSASVNVLSDTLIGGTLGALTKGKYAEKFVENVAKRAATKITSQWAKRVSQKTLVRWLGRTLKGSLSNALEGAVADLLSLVKGNPKKLTWEKFWDNTAKNLVSGGVFADLDKVLTPKTKDVVARIPAAKKKEFLKGLGNAAADKTVEAVIHKGTEEAMKKSWGAALDSVLAKAKGNESPKELQRRAIAELFDKKNTEMIRKMVENRAKR